MNLHEECLLKFLSNPAKLSNLTELLIRNNEILMQDCHKTNVLANGAKLGYSTKI